MSVNVNENVFQVYTGLVKMYRAEVLCKFPVIQHVKFGSVFSLEAASLPPGPGILATNPGTAATPRPGMMTSDSPRPGAGPVSRTARPELPPGLLLGRPQ